jgi:hypothetical protein
MCREISYIKELQSKPNQPTFSFESKVTLALLLEGGAFGGAENIEAPAEKPAIQTRGHRELLEPAVRKIKEAS